MFPLATEWCAAGVGTRHWTAHYFTTTIGVLLQGWALGSPYVPVSGAHWAVAPHTALWSSELQSWAPAMRGQQHTFRLCQCPGSGKQQQQAGSEVAGQLFTSVKPFTCTHPHSRLPPCTPVFFVKPFCIYILYLQLVKQFTCTNPYLRLPPRSLYFVFCILYNSIN